MGKVDEFGYYIELARASLDSRGIEGEDIEMLGRYRHGKSFVDFVSALNEGREVRPEISPIYTAMVIQDIFDIDTRIPFGKFVGLLRKIG